MKAHEAREMSQKQLDTIKAKALEEIYMTINSEIKDGNFECNYYKAIHPSAVSMLKEDGYIVEHDYNQMDGHTYTIKW